MIQLVAIIIAILAFPAVVRAIKKAIRRRKRAIKKAAWRKMPLAAVPVLLILAIASGEWGIAALVTAGVLLTGLIVGGLHYRKMAVWRPRVPVKPARDDRIIPQDV